MNICEGCIIRKECGMTLLPYSKQCFKARGTAELVENVALATLDDFARWFDEKYVGNWVKTDDGKLYQIIEIEKGEMQKAVETYKKVGFD